MNISEIKPCDVANGPGVRVSVFVSGCTHHCKGCFNEKTWDFNAGTPCTEETFKYILSSLSPSYITGLTLLGGEPFQNQEGLLALVKKVKEVFPTKSIWCFTGYLFEDVKDTELIKYIDVLVDGRFVEEKKNLMLKFRGSENQRIIDVKESLKTGKIVFFVV